MIVKVDLIEFDDTIDDSSYPAIIDSSFLEKTLTKSSYEKFINSGFVRLYKSYYNNFFLKKESNGSIDGKCAIVNLAYKGNGDKVSYKMFRLMWAKLLRNEEINKILEDDK